MANKLRRARRLIERGWCQRVFAKDKQGAVAPIKSRYAVAWCANGACIRAGADRRMLGKVLHIRDDLTDLVNWNDAPRRTKAQVLAAFDRAIALAEESAQ